MVTETELQAQLDLGARLGPKRVLFVGGEDHFQTAVRERLWIRTDIEAAFVKDAESAFRELRNAAFHLVVSGLPLPAGVALLQRVKDEYPDLARVTVSNQFNAIFSALPVSHQILASPCRPEHLFNIIDRTCRLRALLADESLRKSIGSIQKLPSLPALYHELMSAVSEPDASPKKVAGIIEQDPAMTIKILQLVNSAYFGLSRHIGRMDRAVVYLGMDMVKNLALTAHVFGSLTKFNRKFGLSFEHEQRHAILVAKVAGRLIDDPQLSPTAFTAGLLHDVGNLILPLSMTDAFAEVRKAANGSARPLYQLEFEMLGVTHAQAGAYLLGLWGLPYPIVEAVAFHHSPDLVGEHAFDVPTAITLADKLIDREFGVPVEIDVEHLGRLGVAAKLQRWTSIAQEEVSSLQTNARASGHSRS